MENEPLPSTPKPQVSDLQAQYDSLHSLFVKLLLVLIIFAGSFWYFLMRQTRTVGADLRAITPIWTNSMAQFERTKPIIDDTTAKMREFARTNPDFAPIAAKYGLRPGPASAPASTARPSTSGKK